MVVGSAHAAGASPARETRRVGRRLLDRRRARVSPDRDAAFDLLDELVRKSLVAAERDRGRFSVALVVRAFAKAHATLDA